MSGFAIVRQVVGVFVWLLGSLVRVVIGPVTWQPPRWSRWVGARGKSVVVDARRRPVRAAIVAMLVVGTLVSAGYGVRWWQHRPRPIEVAVNVTPPPPTPIEERLKPLPAVIGFSASVAPLSAIGKPVTTGIDLSPKLDGTWHWRSDHELVFDPKVDWPVGTHFTARMQKRGLVADKLLLDSYDVEFDSAPFTIEVAEKQFYQDPIDPALKKVVLTYQFSHPVDAASFEKALSLTFVPGTKQESERTYKAEVSYDKLHGKAYVHSAPVDIPQRDANMKVVVDKGVRARAGGRPTSEPVETEVAIAGLYNFLKVASSTIQIVDNERNEPEQVLLLETSAGVSEAEMKRSVQAWLLPEYDPADADEAKNKRPHQWTDPERIDPELLKQGKPLQLEAIAQEQEYSTTHSFRIHASAGRYVYVQVGKGLRAFGGYLLGDPFIATTQVPPYPQQLRILHTGSLLSLGGEKRVSVFARDVPGMEVEISRVLPDQLQNVVTMSGGYNFSHPNFSGYYNIDNATERFVEDRALPQPGTGKPIYEGIDLGKYLGEGRRGVFMLHVRAWDPVEKRTLAEEDSRIVVVTDLGILSKQTETGERDVFVASIRTGDPVAGVKISVLGKNGIAVLTAFTDAQGHAQLGSLEHFSREKQPALILAEKSGDSSFLPLGGSDRLLDYSRFDTGGVRSGERPQSLSAYVFSDRGIYRPGEEIRAGVLARANDWKTSLDGVPIELEITDSRGLIVKKQRVKLPASGLVELRHTTPEVAPTGTYTVQAYLLKADKTDALLGSTTVRVREFVPDKMKLAVHFSTEHVDGWVKPEQLKGRVTLTNLFGTPAEGRTVRGKLSLSPALPSFPRLADYTFFDPLLAKEAADEDLDEQKTDDKGEATFDLGLQRWKPATYRLTLSAEGFEEGSGRGVSAEASVVVSPMPFLVGYKADGDLSYLSKGANRKIDLVAVNPGGERVAQGNLRAVLYERKFVSVLTKQGNGTYKYESIKREVELSQKPLAIAKDGTALALATSRPGDFTMVVRGEHELDLQRVEFTVAGAANLTRSMEKNAELGLQLKSKDVNPGDDLEMELKAPYTGAGLITIERDHVYSYKWFKSKTNASVQTIKVPADLEGGGYVAVSYLRDAGSDEVFASPLSYAVAPFSISRKQREVKVTVDVPELSRPGEPLAIKVKADRQAKAIVFAVDEGILRIAHYATPDPLAFFFQKRELGVRTAQILDLVLPEFSRLMAAVAPGGDAEGAAGGNLNPFKRRHEPPVAFWSGIVDVGPSQKTFTYDVPDTFNGTLRVMALVVEPAAVGMAERKLIVRGDYVLSPAAPLAVAPGDEFELTTSIANNVEKSGDHASVEVTLEVTPGLEIIGPHKTQLTIAAMHEGKTSFKLRATEHLGAATATLVASGAGKPARLRSELSVRPAVPYTVTFQAGHLKDGDKRVPVPRQLYSEFRTLSAGISRLPLGLTHGLVDYLKKFPHGCTEQITSQVVPAVALGKHPELGIATADANVSFAHWIDLVRARQNDEGAFGMWAASPRSAPLPSVWTLLMLQEAKDRGFAVPADTLKAGIGYLQGLASHDGDSLADERLRAMAIYTLTRTGQVTTSYASALKKRLEADFPKEWKSDLTAAYLASTLALLKQTDRARTLVDGVKLGVAVSPDWDSFYDPLARDAQLLYLVAKHFPDRATAVTQAQLDALVEPIFGGSYNTFSSAFTILALETYGHTAGGDAKGLSILEELSSGRHALPLPSTLLPVATFSADATALDFTASGPFGAYWLVEQAGFDRKVPTEAIAKHVEVFREYTDDKGKPVDRVAVGDEIRVHVRVRATDKELIPNLALVDLLPGGFEVVMQEQKRQSGAGENDGEEQAERGTSAHEEGEGGEGAGDGDGDAAHEEPSAFALPITVDGTSMTLDFGDVREDRVVLYTSGTKDVQELVYVLKATNVGTYRTAPLLADSMYDRSVLGRSVGGMITVYRK
ncbi:MAG: MG2 domain-containing protein [Polyangia bacterium]